MSDAQGWARWAPEELPASVAARSVLEVLAGPETPRERKQRVTEERATAERAASGRESDSRSFIDRVLGRDSGTAVTDVLARSTEATDDTGGPSPRDLRRARQLLDEAGLGHCLPHGSGVIFDANLSALEPRRTREAPADGDAVLRAESRALDRREAATARRTDDLIREAQRRRTPPGTWPAWL